jgi:peptidoglycan/xylan/chitin deacetylase (PgdA/CDA1 family)
MFYLHEHGYVCLPLDELCRHQENGRSRPRKTFALTFDDSHEDFFERAYPILHDLGFTATVFVVTNWTHGQSNLEREGNNQHLTWEQIEILRKNGISFGSHTCTHSRLPGLPQEEIRHELIASKECLETKLGQKIDWLAYPYGSSTDEIQRMAKDAGYKAAFGVSHGKSGRFNVWRRQCLKDDSRLGFILRLNPLYHLVDHLLEETEVGRFLLKIKNLINSRGRQR